MAKGRRINVVYGDNGSGLSRDAIVVRDALRRAGHCVWLTPRAPRSFPVALNYAPELTRQAVRLTKQRAIRAWARRSRLWDVNIFLESLVPEYFECARVNYLLPNEEWLPDRDRKLLGEIDLVLFKTRHAMGILASEAKAAAFIGFTSPDRRDPSVCTRWGTALHICGWNPHKGTAAILSAWSRHPLWEIIDDVRDACHRRFRRLVLASHAWFHPPYTRRHGPETVSLAVGRFGILRAMKLARRFADPRLGRSEYGFTLWSAWVLERWLQPTET